MLRARDFEEHFPECKRFAMLSAPPPAHQERAVKQGCKMPRVQAP